MCYWRSNQEKERKDCCLLKIILDFSIKMFILSFINKLKLQQALPFPFNLDK